MIPKVSDPVWVRLFSLLCGSYLLFKGLREREFKRRGGRELKMPKVIARLMCLGLGIFFIWVAIFRS